MKFLDQLAHEHDLIEAVAASLYGWAQHQSAPPPAAAPADPDHRGADHRAARLADGAAYLRFFRLYAGRYHHAREEDILFPALIVETEVPGDRGPIAVLLQDHAHMAGLLDQLEAVLADEGGAGPRTAALGAAYAEALIHHIDAENSVLIPECETRFRRAGISTLPDREPDADELAARSEGERLAARHPPARLPFVRGDGCPACPAYGDRCDGVEREWWSEHEWEDFFERNGNG